jgi:amidase
MLNIEEYTARDGLGLAALVASGDVTPHELMQTSLAAIERLNPKINAVCRTLSDGATAIKEGLPIGPFTGVPFLTKELIPHAKGVRCDAGSRLAEGLEASHDSSLMARFRLAGFVHIGNTQTPELGYSPTTENKLFGPVHNPWNLAHSAGGSSGGAAAAVAAGIVPIAHASDGGGSIRIPASCNGLVGLKPSRDRVPSGPDMADPLCGLAVEFAVARSVRDVAALLDAVSGADLGAPGLPVPPRHPFLSLSARPPERLRVAWTTRTTDGKAVHPECTTAVEQTVKLLESLGHIVVEDMPSFDWETYLKLTHIIWTAFTVSFADTLSAATGRKPGPDTLEAVTLACYEDGKRYSAMDLINAMAYGNVVTRKVAQFFEGFDVLVSPTAARPPVRLGEIDQDRAGLSALDWTRQVFSYCPFTLLFNTTGQPAISLPTHWTADGLPVGVQFAARLGEEATLLQLAAQVEGAQPWMGRHPPTHVAAPALAIPHEN